MHDSELSYGTTVLGHRKYGGLSFSNDTIEISRKCFADVFWFTVSDFVDGIWPSTQWDSMDIHGRVHVCSRFYFVLFFFPDICFFATQDGTTKSGLLKTIRETIPSTGGRNSLPQPAGGRSLQRWCPKDSDTLCIE